MITNRPRFSIYTLGCKVNQYESQAIAEQLEAHGFIQVAADTDCEFVIINSCAVTAESVRKAKQITRRAVKLHPEAYILVAGCASQLTGESFAAIPGVDCYFGTRNKNSIVVHALELWERRKKNAAPVSLVLPPDGAIEPMTITRFDRTRAYVKIQDGCNGKCAYCIIPSLRGRVVSRSEEDVISEVKGLVEGGCREVVLTGIETSAYEYDLASVIESLDAMPGLERIRLGSLDPSFMKPWFIDRIAGLKKVAPHFHLSLQSGSDTVLMRMKRRYLIDTALTNIAYLRQAMPNVHFSTDLIVGFPGETMDEFEQTLMIAEKVRFLHIHIFPFSPRPGTSAATYPDQIPESVKGQRARLLAGVADRIRDQILIERMQEGSPLSVLVETVDENRICTGHSAEFIEVVFFADENTRRGDTVWLKPISVNDGKICGDLIPNNNFD